MNDSRDEVIKLTEREKARDVSVWFESRNNFLHPTVELLANATDEIFNNFSSGTITVILHKYKKTIEIIDTGRGIPIGEKKDGEYNYIALLLTLFAGTNYKNDENGKVTTGEHGLGLTVVNYNSTYFRLKSNTKRYFAEIEFKDGGNIAKVPVQSFISRSNKLTNCFDENLIDLFMIKDAIDLLCINNQGKAVIINTNQINIKNINQLKGIHL